MTHATDLQIATAVQTLPDLVRRYERQIDEALITYGRIAAALPQARLEMNLSAVVGQKVLEHFSASGSAIVAARGHSVAGHRLADKVADALNLVTAAGDERPKPSNEDSPSFFTGAEVSAPVPVG